jgi:hypothetical protein
MDLDSKNTWWDRISKLCRVPVTRHEFTQAGGSYYDYEEAMRKKYPVRYFLFQYVPLQWKYFHYRFIRGPIKWIRYRTTNRSHVLKIQTLEPGWWDRDQRMLHAMFQILVDFIELELPQMMFSEKKKYNIKYGVRNREAGLAYLDWEIAETATPQQDDAFVKKELYLWWKDYRLKRDDPWSEPNIWDISDKMKVKDQEGSQAGALEHIYYEEDQRMLKKLIEIRSSLWT